MSHSPLPTDHGTDLDGPLYAGLPFVVRPENVARYADGHVYILDRRVYPFTTRFVTCQTYDDVARAITDMVTQSAGPAYAAAYGMVLAAHSVRNASTKIRLETLGKAADTLGSARPTNRGIFHAATELLAVGTTAIAQGDDLEESMLGAARARLARGYTLARRRGEHAAALIPDGGTFLSHCWPETGLVYAALVAREQGKHVSAFCSETRPYLQGARLTADAMVGLGLPTTVLTDGMQAHAMSQSKISLVLTGADRVTMAGHVINKVGTLQAALAATHFSVPFYSFTRGPDPKSRTGTDVEIEERAGDEVLHCLEMRTAAEGVQGYYPAFDVTPPELITGLITTDGVVAPADLADHYPGPAGARP
ncbi:s-methyl-5-thioribose-1-phosphate isomerase [Streptomyces iranensis]|uniref:s-methyl-5-thioribose-1-phosphate isomerase n=1 Tax=Streptomyces iranensis TaxID=576784 RepID=UPI0039B78D67